MALKDVKKEDVIEAIKRYDEIGEEKLLIDYKAGKSTRYYLEYNDKYYQQKLIARIVLNIRGRQRGANATKTREHFTKLGFKIANSSYVDTTSNLLAEEVDTSQQYKEGSTKTVTVNAYERNPEARKKCLQHHGYECSACSFNFEDFYGAIGRNYIHVHHVVPLSKIRSEYELDPINDLVPICPNCHAMIHRTQDTLTVEQLIQSLEEKDGNKLPRRKRTGY